MNKTATLAFSMALFCFAGCDSKPTGHEEATPLRALPTGPHPSAQAAADPNSAMEQEWREFELLQPQVTEMIAVVSAYSATLQGLVKMSKESISLTRATANSAQTKEAFTKDPIATQEAMNKACGEVYTNFQKGVKTCQEWAEKERLGETIQKISMRLNSIAKGPAKNVIKHVIETCKQTHETLVRYGEQHKTEVAEQMQQIDGVSADLDPIIAKLNTDLRALKTLAEISKQYIAIKPSAEDLRRTGNEAKEDDAERQCTLGFDYYKGRGVEKNFVEAVIWFRKAADRGNTAAQCALGGCYILGQGVREDFVEGYAWLNLASVKDKDAAKARDAVETKLSPQQVGAAQKRTKELRDQIEARLRSGR